MTQPAGDGHRVTTECADGCGAEVVCLPDYVGRARCVGCGRRHHGVTATGKVPLEQPGASWPARLDPNRLTRSAEAAPAAPEDRRGLVEEWPLDDPRLPVRVVKFIAQLDGARVCHTVSLAGAETIGVHLPGLLAAMFERREVAASVRPRKVDLKRTKTGRRKVQRFDPIVTPAHTDWPSYVLVRAGRGLVKVTVTRATEIIKQRMGS